MPCAGPVAPLRCARALRAARKGRYLRLYGTAESRALTLVWQVEAVWRRKQLSELFHAKGRYAHTQLFNELQLKIWTGPKSIHERDKCQGMT